MRKAFAFSVPRDLSSINMTEAMAAIEAEARALVEVAGQLEEAAQREGAQQNSSDSTSAQQLPADPVNGLAAAPPPTTPAEDGNATDGETPMDVDQPGNNLKPILRSSYFSLRFNIKLFSIGMY